MKKTARAIIDNLILRYPQLDVCKSSVLQALTMLINTYELKGKLLVCGNGGSAADAEHIVGELMKGFLLKRKISQPLANEICMENNGTYICKNLQQPLEAISLVSQTGLMTAFANDQAADVYFAQQVLGYGKEEDVLLGISTSGNSNNVIYAAQVAKVLGMKTIGLTGHGGGKLNNYTDINIIVPEQETFKIQELHLPVYHALCAAIEEEFFGGDKE